MTRDDLPSAIDSEQSILGALMLVPAAWAKVGDWLTEDDFFRHDHRVIYRAMVEHLRAGKPVDRITLLDWLEAHALLSDVPGGYLSHLESTTPSAANLVAYAEIVVEKAKLRKLIALGAKAQSLGFNPEGCDSSLLVSQVQRELSALNVATSSAGPQPPKPAMGRWFSELSDRYERGDRITGVPSPWAEVNKLTAGWQPGELIIVAAPPNVGKSVMGFNQLAHSGLNGLRGLGFSLEMSYEAVLQRMVSAYGNIPHAWLSSPATGKDDPQQPDYFAQLNHCIRDLSAATFLVDDQPRLTAEQITARAKREHLRKPLDLIVVDHLHDMRRTGKDLVNEIADDCRALKALAKECRCPVIALAQLNRGEGRPTLTRLRASGGIEEVADLVLLMHREDYQKFDGRDPSPVEVIFAKGRNIPSGRTVYLRNRYDVQRLDDMPEGYEPPKPDQAPKPQSRGYTHDGRRAAANG